MQAPLPIPDEPLRVAMIGAGMRAQYVYQPLWESLNPWCVPVAVCDPVAGNGRTMAEALGVPYYADIRQLVKDRPMEAALIVTPVPSHHSLSVFLSSHGIHNLAETTWASMYCQAREMAAVARANRVIVRVGENFFRYPIDRFAQAVRDSGYLGRIGRIVSYADHTGYHNDSRWIAFAGCHPDWVQSLEHAMDHPAFYSMPQRRHEQEALKARFFHFPAAPPACPSSTPLGAARVEPSRATAAVAAVGSTAAPADAGRADPRHMPAGRGDFLVMDVGCGHVKGHLGRHPRPGYTEWQGERGTLVHRATGADWGHDWGHGLQTELRYVSDARLAPAQEAAGNLNGGGVADVLTQAVCDCDGDVWYGMHADTPQGRIAFESMVRGHTKIGLIYGQRWYGVAVMEHIVDFALAVQGLRASEFTDADALMSQMMEIGVRESVLQEGRRIRLPIEGELESDARTRERERQQFGCDPLDVEAMLAVSFPKP